MTDLSKLLEDTNGTLPEGWEFHADDDGESFKLLKLDAILTDEGVEDEHVATIYVMEDFFEFLGAYYVAVQKEGEDEYIRRV